MSFTAHLSGSEVEKAIRSLRLFPRKIQTKQVRIAMNAAMAPLKRLAVENAPSDKGLLKKSMRIKVKVPDASYSTKHHGKPAYGLLGAGRGLVAVRSIGKTGKLGRISARTAAAAEKLTKTGKGKIVPKRASRYSHLAEKKSHFLAKARSQGESLAMEAFVRKLVPGIYAEAANIYAG